MAQAQGIENIIQKSTSLTADQVQLLLDSDFGSPKTIRKSLEEITDPTTDRVMEKLSKCMGIKFAKDIIINDISMDMIRGISITYAKQFEILPFKDASQQLSLAEQCKQLDGNDWVSHNENNVSFNSGSFRLIIRRIKNDKFDMKIFVDSWMIDSWVWDGDLKSSHQSMMATLIHLKADIENILD